MVNIKKSFLPLLLAFTVLFGLAFIVTPAPPAVAAPAAHADDCLIHGHAHDMLPYSNSYVGNANSGIFHYSDCRYVYRMAARNKVYFDSRSEAINSGYRPCKVCSP